jgi:hypothetical protein
MSKSIERAQSVIDKIKNELETNQSRAIDILYDELDQLLLDSKFDDAKVMIIAIAQSDLPLSLLLSALTVSHPWRVELGDARAQLVGKVSYASVFSTEKKEDPLIVGVEDL